ncbi:hypothetical protein PBY51_011216 [Eleginops maclovinus]|uniref:Uncharacterized protein n=1 Tax=Eleginops maclovinus TaxID=56733 RepID=A0AAN7XC49_ELEMC|nr:hypothetical protein PBY51_011216 [Eleginops maclovinus]
MDHSFRRFLQKDLRVLNQREEQDLQRKLDLLDKQHRFTLRLLQQRREALVKEKRRVVMVKTCEPKATVNIAMREIRAQTSERSCRLLSAEEEQRSVSAPVRRRGNIHSSISLLQMKNIARIDKISEKERALQKQRDREEGERKRRVQMEETHSRVTEFIQRLRDRKHQEEEQEKPP